MRDVYGAANEGFRIFGGTTEFGLGPEEDRTRDSDREYHNPSTREIWGGVARTEAQSPKTDLFERVFLQRDPAVVDHAINSGETRQSVPETLFRGPLAILIEIGIIRGLVPQHDQREAVGLQVDLFAHRRGLPPAFDVDPVVGQA